MISLLKFSPAPVLSRDDLPAIRCSAMALHFVIIIICRRPVVSQFLSSLNVAHCDKHNLALDTNVRVAGMVAKNHAAFPFFFAEGADKKIITDLDFSRSEPCSDAMQMFTSKDMSALDTDDFAFTNGSNCKKTLAMNGTGLHGSLFRKI